MNGLGQPLFLTSPSNPLFFIFSAEKKREDDLSDGHPSHTKSGKDEYIFCKSGGNGGFAAKHHDLTMIFGCIVIFVDFFLY
jgi:hypothetical protein